MPSSALDTDYLHNNTIIKNPQCQDIVNITLSQGEYMFNNIKYTNLFSERRKKGKCVIYDSTGLS